MHPNGKAKIQNDFNGLYIQTPSKFNFLIPIIFLAWVGIWFSFASDILFDLDKQKENPDYFVIFILVVWSIAIIQFLKILLWGLFGKEILRVTSHEIKLKDTILGIGKTIQIPSHELTTIEFNQPAVSEESDYPGKILLHRGTEIYSYGSNIDMNEAKYIIDLIRNKIPHLKTNHQNLSTL